MAKILVRAVRKGFYPMFDHAGKKIPESGQLHYPASDTNKGARAGAPFEVNEEDFAPRRMVNGVEIGWMERVDGGSNEPPAKRRGRPPKIATQEEADASTVPLPHTRREKARRTVEELSAKPAGKES